MKENFFKNKQQLLQEFSIDFGTLLIPQWLLERGHFTHEKIFTIANNLAKIEKNHKRKELFKLICKQELNTLELANKVNLAYKNTLAHLRILEDAQVIKRKELENKKDVVYESAITEYNNDIARFYFVIGASMIRSCNKILKDYLEAMNVNPKK